MADWEPVALVVAVLCLLACPATYVLCKWHLDRIYADAYVRWRELVARGGYMCCWLDVGQSHVTPAAVALSGCIKNDLRGVPFAATALHVDLLRVGNVSDSFNPRVMKAPDGLTGSGLPGGSGTYFTVEFKPPEDWKPPAGASHVLVHCRVSGVMKEPPEGEDGLVPFGEFEAYLPFRRGETKRTRRHGHQ